MTDISKNIAIIEQDRGIEIETLKVNVVHAPDLKPYVDVLLLEDEDANLAISVDAIPALIEALLKAQRHIEDHAA